MRIAWVVLDVGETLIDETRVWSAWAREIGVSPLTFAAVYGAAIAAGGDQREAFQRLGLPDWRQHGPAVEARYGGFRAQDLYPDALGVVERLHGQGRKVAIIANQPAVRHGQLLALGFRPDVIAMSEEMGAAKPSDAFYAAALALMGLPDPSSVAHVGDRVDNDVIPARRNGLRSVWLRRGPWGRIAQDTLGDAELTISSLDELVERIGELDR